ncbi:MAG: saccharopine dehydrogenase NADP-binding domain-containing protein [Deltaproteobacteria bacterium]|nr:saccharopine dehydrogenase NADP-binding domain-containing protein [Deltaproteobacteria bacterium]
MSTNESRAKPRSTRRPSAVDRSSIVVIGAGAMGRITIRDLVETAPPSLEIVVADNDLGAARREAEAHAAKRPVSAIRVDATDLGATAKALAGAFGVIAAVRHELNVPIMRAALAAGAHYTDLGGLFHYTRKQLPLHERFEKKGLLAVLGMGAAPGVVNILARAAADALDTVAEIHIMVGNVDRTIGRAPTVLGTPYSLETFLDEASMPAPVFTKGEFAFVEPMSGTITVDFGGEVGVRRPSYTIHSETATLPLSYAHKGVQEVTFRIAFPDELDQKLRFLSSMGFLAAKPIAVGSTKVAPRAVLTALARALPRPVPPAVEPVPDEHEVLRAVVRGTKGSRRVEEVVDCHCPGLPEWGFGVDVDTGCPPSIFMQMLHRGDIEARGVLAPEVAVPAEPFFAELRRRKMTVLRSSATHTG